MVKRGAATGVSVGGSSILVIFVLLCLTTFATLSLVSAAADKKLTDKSAQAITEYYEADSRAEEILAQIDAVLHESLSQSGGDDFYAKAGPLISEIDQSIRVDGKQVEYAVPLNDSQELRVSLELAFSGTPMYERREWKVVNTGEWQPENESYNLWNGSEDIVILG